MKRVDIAVGGLLILLGVYLISKVGEYTYMTEFSPGPGFVSFWLGVVLVVLAGVLVISSILKASPQKVGKDFYSRLGKAILFLIGLGVTNLFLEWLGFILTISLVALAMMIILNRKTWLMNITIAFFTALVLHFVFREFLEVTLPKGIFGF